MRRSGRSVALVSFESLSRTTAAGNHIDAVRRALATRATVTVCGSNAGRPIVRYRDAIIGWLRAGECPIVYVRAHPVATLVVVGARLRRQRVVIEINGPVDDIMGAHRRVRWLLPLLSAGQRASVRLAHRVIVPTPGLADHIRRMRRAVDVSVIPAGFDDSLFHPADVQAEPDRRVVFVGANAAWQGVDDLIAAAHDPAWPRDVSVAIVGPFDAGMTLPEAGPDRPGISFTGVLPPADVAALLRTSMAAVSPKRYRGTSGANTGQAPLKVFEAMGSGVPCIVTAVPIQDVLIRQHECGLVVPPEDPRALAEAVAAYAADHALRRRHAANAHAAAAHYSWSALAEATRSVVIGDHT